MKNATLTLPWGMKVGLVIDFTHIHGENFVIHVASSYKTMKLLQTWQKIMKLLVQRLIRRIVCFLIKAPKLVHM